MKRAQREILKRGGGAPAGGFAAFPPVPRRRRRRWSGSRVIPHRPGRRLSDGVVLLAALVVVLALASAAESAPLTPRAAICQVFRPCAPALRVAACESAGWRPGERLRFYTYALGAAGERGLFQIHPVHFGWLNEQRLFDPLYNARIAYRLSRGGTSWRHWTCRP